MRTTDWKEDILPRSLKTIASIKLGRLFYNGLHYNLDGYDIYPEEPLRVLEAELYQSAEYLRLISGILSELHFIHPRRPKLARLAAGLTDMGCKVACSATYRLFASRT